MPSDRNGTRRRGWSAQNPRSRWRHNRPGRGHVGGLRHAARGGGAGRCHLRAATRRNRRSAGRVGRADDGGALMVGSVLIVDDSMTVRMSLIELLRDAGLEAVGCGSVAEARSALAEQVFGLVILDVLLPDGDGVELLQEIRAMPAAASTAVMMLSTETEIRDRVRGLTTGADEYVGKPYDPTYLVARARELVRRGGDSETPGQETILLVDDSVTFRNELQVALEQASYRVVTAGSGEDGLRVAADVQPSGIVVDGFLPGIDGDTLIRRIRLDAARCFLLTGSEDRSAEVRALDAGADAFAVKEHTLAVIGARIRVLLRAH